VHLVIRSGNILFEARLTDELADGKAGEVAAADATAIGSELVALMSE
jgi:hypothetical protein